MLSTRGRQAAVAGLAFIVADLAALLAGGPLPAIDDPVPELADFYADSSTRLLAQAYLRGIAMALLVVFAVALRAALRDRDDWARVFELGAVVVAAIELVRVAVVAALALNHDRLPEDSLAVLHAGGLVLGAAIAFPLAAGTLALWPRLRAGFPAWLGPAGAILAVGWLATGFRSVATNHTLWTAGTVVTVLWGVWLAALCWFVRQVPEPRSSHVAASGGSSSATARA
jgi:hypothetical protein